jgi:hypothetical protein
MELATTASYTYLSIGILLLQLPLRLLLEDLESYAAHGDGVSVTATGFLIFAEGNE